MCQKRFTICDQIIWNSGEFTEEQMAWLASHFFSPQPSLCNNVKRNGWVMCQAVKTGTKVNPSSRSNIENRCTDEGPPVNEFRACHECLTKRKDNVWPLEIKDVPNPDVPAEDLTETDLWLAFWELDVGDILRKARNSNTTARAYRLLAASSALLAHDSSQSSAVASRSASGEYPRFPTTTPPTPALMPVKQEQLKRVVSFPSPVPNKKIGSSTPSITEQGSATPAFSPQNNQNPDHRYIGSIRRPTVGASFSGQRRNDSPRPGMLPSSGRVQSASKVAGQKLTKRLSHLLPNPTPKQNGARYNNSTYSPVLDSPASNSFTKDSKKQDHRYGGSASHLVTGARHSVQATGGNNLPRPGIFPTQSGIAQSTSEPASQKPDLRRVLQLPATPSSKYTGAASSYVNKASPRAGCPLLGYQNGSPSQQNHHNKQVPVTQMRPGPKIDPKRNQSTVKKVVIPGPKPQSSSDHKFLQMFGSTSTHSSVDQSQQPRPLVAEQQQIGRNSASLQLVPAMTSREQTPQNNLATSAPGHSPPPRAKMSGGQFLGWRSPTTSDE